jgi:hypothetical protein
VGNNRSCDGRGGKHSRNRWRATTGPPQTLRRQAQRLSRFGGRAARSGRPDADEVDVVVGGAVGGRLKVTCRGRPAVSWRRADRWRLRNGASPARRLCRWLEPGLLYTGKLNVPSEACVGEPSRVVGGTDRNVGGLGRA